MNRWKIYALLGFCVACGGATFARSLAAAEPVRLGAGGYWLERPFGAKGPPEEIYATPEALVRKIPTNDWWSSLAWMPFSERQYPHPLAVCATPGGMRIFYPGANITANRDAIFGFMPADGSDDFVLGHSAQATFPDARVSDWSDWFVTAKFAVGERSMLVTCGHGSPYVFATLTGGVPELRFAEPPKVFSGEAHSAVIGLAIHGKHYGLFAPAGSRWSGLGTKTLLCQAPASPCYFSIGILPDDRPDTLALFRQHAYAHVTDSRVTWSYDETSSAVTTRFTVSTKNHGGESDTTLMALYPHQWRHTSANMLAAPGGSGPSGSEPLGYGSVRGRMRLIKGNAFDTRYRFAGVLPGLPRTPTCDPAVIAELLKAEVATPAPPSKDSYWDGKYVGRLATLLPIADVHGQSEIAEELQKRLRDRLEAWLSAAREKPGGRFCYDKRWSTLIGYPASYGSDVELNDHHFHYGYFIRAAAELARHDPAWAKPERWGAMIDLLIRDVAAPDRDDPLFPFLRNFDPHAGHSWASGHAKFGDGNNNESSSEAMNAWYGVLLWGQFTGDKRLRDLGAWLYTTEMQAINDYWFDIHDQNHPASYTPSVVTMVWGGKGANGTWFTANPEMVHGINWLPITAGSLYLGQNPDYVRKNYRALVAENGSTQWDAWADLIWMYEALDDPDDALRQFEAARGQRPPLEEGNSLANAYQWICALKSLGKVTTGVTADTPLFAVFDRGATRSYCVYNERSQPRAVLFSDGHELLAPARSFQLDSGK